MRARMSSSRSPTRSTDLAGRTNPRRSFASATARRSRCANSNRARMPSLPLRRRTNTMARAKAGRAVRVVGHEPCFEVADVERAVNHYQLLDFTISYHDEDYAFAHRDNLTIHLAHSEQPTTGPGALYIHVNDADRLAEDWRAAGMNLIGPNDYDYGKREGSHRDPDGNLLRFGSPLRRSANSASASR